MIYKIFKITQQLYASVYNIPSAGRNLKGL